MVVECLEQRIVIVDIKYMQESIPTSGGDQEGTVLVLWIREVNGHNLCVVRLLVSYLGERLQIVDSVSSEQKNIEVSILQLDLLF